MHSLEFLEGFFSSYLLNQTTPQNEIAGNIAKLRSEKVEGKKTLNPNFLV